MKKIMMLVLQLRHEGRHCMDRIGKRTGCKETQDRGVIPSKYINEYFFYGEENCERTWEREVRTVLLILNLDAVAYCVQRYLYLEEIYVFINSESNSSNKKSHLVKSEGRDLYLPANSCAQVLHDDPVVCPCRGAVPENIIL